jgi:hypothetical protein
VVNEFEITDFGSACETKSRYAAFIAESTIDVKPWRAFLLKTARAPGVSTYDSDYLAQ